MGCRQGNPQATAESDHTRGTALGEVDSRTNKIGTGREGRRNIHQRVLRGLMGFFPFGKYFELPVVEEQISAYAFVCGFCTKKVAQTTKPQIMKIQKTAYPENWDRLPICNICASALSSEQQLDLPEESEERNY